MGDRVGRTYAASAAWAQRALVLSLLSATIGTATQASAAVPLSFPADPKLVPFAVGAAFALPAIIALLFSLLMRLGRRIGALGGIAVIVLVGLAVSSYLPSGLFQ